MTNQAIEGSVNVFSPELSIWRGLNVQPVAPFLPCQNKVPQIVKYTWSSNSLPWFPQSWTPSHRFSHQRFCMWRVCGWTRWPWGGMEVKDKVRDAYQVMLKWKIHTRNIIVHIIFQYCFTSKFDLQGHPIVRKRNSCWERWVIQIFFCIRSFLYHWHQGF